MIFRFSLCHSVHILQFLKVFRSPVSMPPPVLTGGGLLCSIYFIVVIL